MRSIRGIEDAVWRASQRILAPGASEVIEDRVRRWISDHPGTRRALDVGCGPGSRLADVGLDAVGVDVHPGWGVTASATRLPFAGGVFDSVWSFGLLHHLCDRAALAALEEMFRVVQPRGYVIVFDGVLPEEWRPMASLVRRLDRGSRFRRQEELKRMLARFGDSWECERITYARTGLEGLFAWMSLQRTIRLAPGVLYPALADLDPAARHARSG